VRFFTHSSLNFPGKETSLSAALNHDIAVLYTQGLFQKTTTHRRVLSREQDVAAQLRSLMRCSIAAAAAPNSRGLQASPKDTLASGETKEDAKTIKKEAQFFAL